MKPNTVGRVRGDVSGAPVQAISTKCGMGLGSVILTMEGEMPIEQVMPGDRVISRDAGAVRVTNVRRQTVSCEAVKILAGSLGDTRPECDVILPEDQSVLVRDWRARALFGADEVTVRAGALIDGEYITGLGVQELEVIVLLFDAPHVLYVDGLEVSGHVAGQALDVAA